MATEMGLEVNENVTEDASWLHLIEDTKHINFAELDAMIKDVNLALQRRAS